MQKTAHFLVKIKFLALPLLMGAFALLAPAAYADEWNPICNDGSLTDTQREAAGCNIAPDTAEDTALAHVRNIINVAIGIIGVVAVIVIIVAGILMMTANGDSSKVAKSRQAIIFAAIGLIIALVAFPIVNFIIDGIGGAGGTSGTP